MYNFVSKFSDCPRCGYHTYESLRSHSFCLECGFSDTIEESARNVIPRWARDAARALKSDETDEISFVPAAG